MEDPSKMHRDLYKKLLNWQRSKDRKPLILKGARQVGKTYLLLKFAQENYQNYLYINFEKDKLVHEFFRDDLAPDKIIEKLGIFYDQDIKPSKTLIIFDEVQECENALISLKYFCEQANDYHLCAAGSLLGVALNSTKGFPVGKVDFMQLHPLSFIEYLAALELNKLVDYLNSIKIIKPLPHPIHQQLIDHLKLYTFIGGMPEAVLSYIQYKDFKKVRNIQNNIINAYVLDFSKHAPKNEIIKIQEVWQSLIPQLAKENKKFAYSTIKKSARAREYELAIQWLKNAGLIHQIFRISKPNYPLSAYIDQSCFKIYLFDTGLLGALANLNPQIIVHGDKLFTEFKGAVCENLVLQMILTNDISQLNYWTSSNTAEIDFILEKDLSIYPLEVKSGTVTKHKSLSIFANKYNPRALVRATLLNLTKDQNLINVPIYLCENIFNLQFE